jgi:hypothetical protein
VAADSRALIRLGFSPPGLLYRRAVIKNGRSGFAVKKIRRPVNSDFYGGQPWGHHIYVYENKGREKMGTQWEKDLYMTSLIIPS